MGGTWGDAIWRERSRAPLSRAEEERLTWLFAKDPVRKMTELCSHRGGHWFDPTIAYPAHTDAAPVARDCYQPGGSEDTGDTLAQYRADRCRAINKGC